MNVLLFYLSECLTYNKLSIFSSLMVFTSILNIWILICEQQVVLYEDELADNGVSLLTVKVVMTNLVSSVDRSFYFVMQTNIIANDWWYHFLVLQRVMPSSWFLLLRFWVSYSLYPKLEISFSLKWCLDSNLVISLLLLLWLIVQCWCYKILKLLLNIYNTSEKHWDLCQPIFLHHHHFP